MALKAVVRALCPPVHCDNVSLASSYASPQPLGTGWNVEQSPVVSKGKVHIARQMFSLKTYRALSSLLSCTADG